VPDQVNKGLLDFISKRVLAPGAKDAGQRAESSPAAAAVV
jgi:hypothetical protein